MKMRQGEYDGNKTGSTIVSFLRDSVTSPGAKNMQTPSDMRVVSVNVGLPREVQWKGRSVSTGIFKEPVAGRIAIHRLNLAGDRQADLSVHGGPEKAIYVYPAEYYPSWRMELPKMEIPWSMFGENLTVEGLREDSVHIGDQFRAGSALVMVTQPRMPCYKLGIKFGRDDILKRFLQSGRTGFYLSVLEEGDVAAGDAITLVKQDRHAIPVSEITRLYTMKKKDRAVLQNMVQVEALPEGWRDYFQEMLEKEKD
jgi:MOSC domain-containing protein YiiM